MPWAGSIDEAPCLKARLQGVSAWSRLAFHSLLMRPLTRLLFLSDFLEVIEDMQVLWIRYHVSRLSVRTNVERNRTEPGPRIHWEKVV